MDGRRLIHTVTWEAAVRLDQAQSALRNMRISIDTNINIQPFSIQIALHIKPIECLNSLLQHTAIQ